MTALSHRVVTGFLVGGGFALAGLAGLGVAGLTANQWAAEWNFPPAGTAQGDVARAAWTVPISPKWSDPPTDVTAKICPLIDNAYKTKMQPYGGWSTRLGTCFWTEERDVLIGIDVETGECRATVQVSTPSCFP